MSCRGLTIGKVSYDVHRYQLAMMIEEEFFHKLFYASTQLPLEESTTTTPKTEEPVKVADPMKARPATVQPGFPATKASTYWSGYKVRESIDEVCAPFMAALATVS